MKEVQKPHKRVGPMSKVKSWLTRPGTIRLALAILRIIAQVAKVTDLF